MTELEVRQQAPPNPLTGTPPARSPAALAALMRAAGLGGQALTATGGWLSSERRTSSATQVGYITDLSRWVVWCHLRGGDPTAAGATTADRFTSDMRDAGLSNTTRARRLAAVSSWYRYLLRNELTERNPFDGMDRPRPPKKSATKGLDETQFEKLLAYAKTCESPQWYALLALMACTACRVSSVIGARAETLGEDKGHQVIDLPVKGGQMQRFVLPAFTLDALGTHLDIRGHHPGLLFTNTKGGPLGQPTIYRNVQRMAARAGIKSAHELSPHGIRHTVLTILHSRGVATHIIQDLAGHADSRTTRGYDLAKGDLDRSPAGELGTIFAAGVARWAPSFQQEVASE